jgi:hypothetical protein
VDDEGGNPNVRRLALLVALGFAAALTHQVGYSQGRNAEAVSRNAMILRQTQQTLTALAYDKAAPEPDPGPRAATDR